jgi:O-antigen ligase
MVNSYLGEALNRGIPGFLLFCLIIFSSLWAVLRRHNRAGPDGLPFLSPVASFLTSLVLATAFYLATISMVGHVPSYLWLLAALCSAYAALPAEPLPQNVSELAPQLLQDARLQRRTGSAAPI